MPRHAPSNGKLSKLWHLPPIVPRLSVGPFGLIGGMAMCAKVRKRDPRMGIVAGVIAVMMPFVLLAVMSSSAQA